MKYQISCIGKSANTPEQNLIDKYLIRINDKVRIKEITFKNDSSKLNIENEGEKLLDISPKGSILVALDKDGKNLSSESLANMIKFYENENFKIINFAIGGPFGHGNIIKSRAKKIISFGKMTWSHLMARVLIIEQIYRAESIFRNHPFHK